MKPKWIEVTWLDHSSFALAHWRERDELDALRPHIVKSAVVLVAEGKHHITIACGFSEFDRFHGEMTIHRGTIKKMRRLK